jgi:acetolactate synthase-1/2/3 large subunit
MMNNYAFGTIAGLQKAHYGTTLGTVFRRGGPVLVDFAAIARAYGVDGVQVKTAAEFKPALQEGDRLGPPVRDRRAMMNEPVPTRATGTSMTSTRRALSRSS